MAQPPSAAGTLPLPLHGRYVDALLPACASWTPATAPWPWMNATIGAHACACSSDHSPVSCGLIRPSGTTEVASAITSPAPPRARPPRWTRCHGVGTPSWSSTEYWHIGETMIRLRRWVPRRSSGREQVGHGRHATGVLRLARRRAPLGRIADAAGQVAGEPHELGGPEDPELGVDDRLGALQAGPGDVAGEVEQVVRRQGVVGDAVHGRPPVIGPRHELHGAGHVGEHVAPHGQVLRAAGQDPAAVVALAGAPDAVEGVADDGRVCASSSPGWRRCACSGTCCPRPRSACGTGRPRSCACPGRGPCSRTRCPRRGCSVRGGVEVAPLRAEAIGQPRRGCRG